MSLWQNCRKRCKNRLQSGAALQKDMKKIKPAFGRSRSSEGRFLGFKKEKFFCFERIRGLCQFPDISVIFGNGSVRGEISGLADVDEHFLGPGGAVFVVGEGLFFCFAVGFEVWEGHEPVFV